MQNTLLPHSSPEAGRHLSFEACFNFRDLGGYATRNGRTLPWRRLFRSMTPQWMTNADVLEAQTLGIELVIDFRGPEHETSGPLGNMPARRLNVGFRRGEIRESPRVQELLDADAATGLPIILDLYAPHFAAAMNALINTQGPVLFHCQLGKDRTGLFAALLHDLCGVSDDDIVADYTLTAAREPLVRALIDVHGDPYQGVQSARFVREPVAPEAMQAVLRRLREGYGDARGYFVAHGVEAGALDAWVSRLLSQSDAQLRDRS